MKKTISAMAAAALLSVGVMPAPVLAEDQSTPAPATTQAKADALKLQLANRFIAAMQTEQMSGMMGQMATVMLPESLEGASADEVAEYRDVITDMTSRMMPRIFDAMAPIYADIFTVEELRALVEFYESDVGQSMITKSFEAAPRMMEAMEVIMPEVMADMAAAMCERFECSAEELREMKAAMQAQ